MSASSSSVLVVPDDALQLMSAHAFHCFPEEMCGLIVGVPSQDGSQRVHEFIPVTNVAASAKLYTIDPKQHFVDYLASLNITAEEHFTTTDDGYILRLYRVPGQNSSSPVVILQHGILGL